MKMTMTTISLSIKVRQYQQGDLSSEMSAADTPERRLLALPPLGK